MLTRAASRIQRLSVQLSSACLLPALIAAGTVLPVTPAQAASVGCNAVNAGGLDQVGAPLIGVKSVAGSFYAGDVLTMTFSSSAALPLSVVNLVTTGPLRLTTSIDLPLLGTGPFTRALTVTGNGATGAEASIVALGALLGVTINLTVRCAGVAGPTTTTLATTTNPTVVGQPAVLTASVATPAGSGQTPNGNVTFTIGGTNYGPVALDASGVATYSTTALPPGSYAVSAAYAGNANFVASSGTLAAAQVVNRANTTTSVTASSNPTFGSAVSFTATTAAVAPGGGTPTGNVIFTIGGVDQSPVALSNGTATLTRSNLAAGAVSVAARYEASTGYNASSGGISGGITVAPAVTTTSVTQSSTSSAFGEAVSFQAQVASGGGQPTGSVIFTVDGVARPAVTLSNGVASVSLTDLAVGAHTVSAAYQGVASFAASNGALSGGHTVGTRPTTTTVSGPGSVVFGTSPTITATVAGAGGPPTGTVVFTVDGQARPAVTLSSGTATLALPGLSVGNHTVSAAYSGAATYGASTGALAGGQAVAAAPTSLAVAASPSAGIYGGSSTFTASVTSAAGVPSGNVVFTVDGVAQAPVALTGGTASITSTALSVGTHTVSASYQGVTNFLASNGALASAYSVARATPSLAVSSSANPAVVGQSVQLTANVTALSGTPGGEVVFTVDGVARPAVSLTGGSATIALPNATVGDHTVSLRYGGDANFVERTSTLGGGQKVNPGNTALSITTSNASAAYGVLVTVTANVAAAAPASGEPAGQVVFLVDGVARPGVALSGGRAQLVLDTLAPGAHAISATYQGSSDFNASTASLAGGVTVNAAATTTTIALDAAAISYGQTARVTATVAAASGRPEGQIVYTINGVAQPAVALVNGVAGLDLTGLAAGTYVISAAYGGSGNHVASASGTTQLVVGAAPTQLGLAASAQSVRFGDAVTLTATLTSTGGTPGGSVEFLAGGTSLGSVTLAGGKAALTVSNLPVGSPAITARYAGTGNFAASTGALGAGFAVTGRVPEMTVSVSPVSATYGQTLTATISVSSSVGTPQGDVVLTVGERQYPAVLNGSGVATLTLSELPPGSHAVSASYAGQTPFLSASASANAVTIARAVTALALVAGTDAVVFGAPVQLRANLSSDFGTPAGSVIFTVDGTDYPASVSDGSAAVSIPGIQAGQHGVSARYAGSATHLPATVALSGGVEVRPAPVALNLSSSAATVSFGGSVTISAVVSSSAGGVAGDVIFSVDGADWGTVAVADGAAQLRLGGLTVGNHAIAARYVPSGNFEAVSAQLAGGVSVVAAPVSVSITPPQGALTVGQAARFALAVTSPGGVPGGQVIVVVDGVEQAAVTLSEGRASFDYSFATSGHHSIGLRYSGSESFAAGDGVVSGGVTVVGAATTLALAAEPPAPVFGQPVSFVAALSSAVGTAGGLVSFSRGGTVIGSAPVTDGVAGITVSDLSPGAIEITASYAGDGAHLGAVAALGLEVADEATTLSLGAEPTTIYAGAPVTFTANIASPAGAVPGSVVFVIDGTDYPAEISGGVARLTVTDLPVGTPAVAARYDGRPGFATSEADLTAPLTVAPAPTDIVVSGQAPRSVAGEAFSMLLSATGGVAPYRFAVTAGALPEGLSLDAATGVVSGTPATPGNYSFTVTASGAAGLPGNVAVDLTVLTPATLLVQAPGAGVYGEAYSASLAASGGTAPYQYGVSGSLPTGVSFDASSGVLSGTPRSLGTFDLVLTVSDANGFTLTRNVALTIAAPAIVVTAELPAGGAFVPYSGQISVSGGTAPYGFAVTSGALPDGLSLDPATGVISGMPRRVGESNFTVTATDTNGFAASIASSISVAQVFTVVLPEAIAEARQGRPYGQALAASGGTAPYRYSVADGALPEGLVLDAATGTISGTPTAFGAFDFTLSASDANDVAGSRAYVLEVAEAATLIPDTDLTPAVAGVAYEQVLGVSGGVGPYSFALVSGDLPEGLQFDAGTGTIAGTPSVDGQFPLVVQITDANGDTITQGFAVVVVAPEIGLTVEFPAALAGEAFVGSVAVSGGAGPFSYALTGALPAGLSFDATSGAITGTPTSVGTFPISITVTDANGYEQAVTGTIAVTASTTLALSAGQTTITFGEMVDLRAKVGSAATGLAGSVVFSVDGSDHARVALVDGAAELALAGLTVGSHVVAARFEPATGFVASSAELTGPVLVVAAPVSVSIAGPQGDITAGTAARFSVRVSSFAGVPTGSVIPVVDGVEQPAVDLVDGRAEFDLDFASKGSHSVSVRYGGSESFAAGLGTLQGGVTAIGAASEISLAANPVEPVYGQSVTLTASVSSASGSPTGLVTFVRDGVEIGSVVLTGGVASLELTDLPPGASRITAVYEGDAVRLGASAELVLDVGDAATALEFSVAPVRLYAGAPVTLTVRLSSDAGAPSGVVIFGVGDRMQSAPLINGSATLAITDLGEGNYPVTARYAGQPGFAASAASLEAELIVDPAPSDIVVSGQAPRSVAGEPLAMVISATGGVGPYGFAITSGALPDGVTLDAATGAIAGTPASAGIYSFTVTATGVAGAPGDVTVNLTVLEPVDFVTLPRLPAGVFGTDYGADLAVSGGTAPLQYDLTGTLPGGLVFDAETGQLTGVPTAVGRFALSLSVTDANGFSASQDYVLEIAAPDIVVTPELPEGGAFVPYAGQIAVSGGSGPYGFVISDGALPEGLSLDSETGAISGTPRAVGEYGFTVTATDANGFGASLPVSISVVKVFTVILPDGLAGGRQLQPYGQSLAATGGTAPYGYGISDGALADRLSLDPSTGVVTGTPTATGVFEFSVTATDANGVSATRAYALNIVEAATLVIVNALAPATAGIPYSQELSVTGGVAPYRFVLISGSLPDGLSFDSGSGTISGTATEDGSFPLVIQVSDGNGDSATHGVVVSVAAPEIVLSLDVPQARAGEAFVTTVVVSGGALPLRFTLDGTLPQGLSFNAVTGAISGTPLGTGNFPISITAQDANGYEQSAAAVISLSAATTLSLSTSMTSVTFGSSAVVQAQVSSTAPGVSGTVIFAVDGVDHASVPVSDGVAQIDLQALTVGPHEVTARFESADGYDSASAALSGGITVTSALVVVSLSGPAGEAVVGASVPFMVTVNSLAGPPGGVIIPVVDGVDQPGVALVDSVAAFEHVFTTSGPHTVAVRYPGSESFAAGSASLGGGLLVTGASTSMSLSASPATPVFGAPVTITATVDAGFGTPGGLVLFTRDGVGIGSVPLSDGRASLVVSDLPAGSSSITASYVGDTANAGASAQIDLVLGNAATALALTANPTRLYAGMPVSFSATLTTDAGAVTGSVVFSIGGSEYPAALNGNNASLTLSNLAQGSYPIAVRFDGAPGFAASQATLASAIVVEPAPSDIVVHAGVPRSVAGEPLAIAVSATGGIGPYSFAVTEGSLPDGLTINADTGSITGTPAAAGRYGFTVTGSGQAGRRAVSTSTCWCWSRRR
ncbi:MAG: Ig-like domain repeat protein [Candidatus Devosia phytovorans]|uniref:Ig-like domain repeat protein n=1 Tax=Candidatus Devosia phytovorans TaxID=3121372 RepID=A0AAJ5VXY9_9HYPH|nr:Ig-like domain repeat protein [Devosia sp.]WEK06205.1 MAG: Ig-like domain repeat protein [Devosia sp.]